jgi:ArsR family transcriptional regulator
MSITVLAALADPTRLSALRLLRDGRERCVCDLMQRLGASQSRMSRHMATLRQAGLVTDRRDAQWVRYRLNPAMPPAVRRLLEAALDLAETAERIAA